VASLAPITHVAVMRYGAALGPLARLAGARAVPALVHFLGHSNNPLQVRAHVWTQAVPTQ
jgi:hypothetical protein